MPDHPLRFPRTRAYHICSSRRPAPTANRWTVEPVIKKAIRLALNRLGYQLVRVNAAPLDRFLSMLKRQGFNPCLLSMWVLIRVASRDAHSSTFQMRATRCNRAAKRQPERHVQDSVARGHKIAWITAGAADKSGSSGFTVCPNDVEPNFLLTQEQADASWILPQAD